MHHDHNQQMAATLGQQPGTLCGMMLPLRLLAHLALAVALACFLHASTTTQPSVEDSATTAVDQQQTAPDATPTPMRSAVSSLTRHITQAAAATTRVSLTPTANAFASTASVAMSFEKVDSKTLFVSEPNPSWFGNGPNERDNKHWNNGNWLKSRFHFSFAEYHDPTRTNFGVLRVMNDDLVQPARGFGTHPHSNMEIATYVIEGELTHKDSMGTQESLGRGSVQFMTAGTGVTHSEFNQSPTTPLRFIQMWITPRHRGLPPNYGSMRGEQCDFADKWAHLVSDVEADYGTPVKINQDANIYVAELGDGKTLDFAVRGDRQAYYLQMEGTAQIDGPHGSDTLKQHDAARVKGPGDLKVTAKDGKAHVLIVEMKKG